MKPESSHFETFRQEIETVVERLLEGHEPVRYDDDKVIRDAVFGFNVFFKHEINLIDSPLLQRLRRIHQAALAVLTYPSSTHTRFEHSLGCTVIADRMIRAINDKHPATPQIDAVQRAEVRLAALLHDCGHGPFSHASESVYGSPPYQIPDVKKEEKSLFGTANPHEIVGYCVVKSEAFKRFWNKVLRRYDPQRDRLLCDLGRISLDRVASMILGQKAGDYPQYLSQMVNGPFDADKFDYIIRDGYFSGLVTAIDVERLFISLDYAPFSQHGYAEYPEDVLCIDVGGATVLEQIQFNKMLLFSSFYHHQKVRAAFRLLVSLFDQLRRAGVSLKGVRLDRASNFLRLDDYDVLSADADDWPDEAKQVVADLRNRTLPKRALVIPKDGLLDDVSRVEYFRLRDDPELRESLEHEIASQAGGAQPVFVDCPEEPTFGVTGFHSLVKVAPDRYVTLDKLYPIAGWVSGYAEYRYRGYVFSPGGEEKQVNKAALKAFEDRGIRLDRRLCSELAKLPP